MLTSQPRRKPAKYTGLRIADQYGIDRRPVQAELANHLALELNDRYPHVEAFFPVGAAVDIADLDIHAAAHQGQQFLEEHVAEVAAATAIDVESRLHGLKSP